METLKPANIVSDIFKCKLDCLRVVRSICRDWTHVLWHLQGDQAHLDDGTLATGNALDASTGAQRTAKTRITRSDGSTVIGHMEVGVMFTTHPSPSPPLCAPVLGVTRLLLHQQCHTSVYAVCTCCCSWQQYAMLLLSGERVQRVSSRTCECGMMMIPQRALFMYTLYMDRKSCLTPLPAPAAAPSAPQKSTSNQERSDVRSSACSSKPPPFRMSALPPFAGATQLG